MPRILFPTITKARYCTVPSPNTVKMGTQAPIFWGSYFHMTPSLYSGGRQAAHGFTLPYVVHAYYSKSSAITHLAVFQVHKIWHDLTDLLTHDYMYALIMSCCHAELPNMGGYVVQNYNANSNTDFIRLKYNCTDSVSSWISNFWDLHRIRAPQSTVTQ